MIVFMSEEALWYVVHTYAGYENKVKDNIEKITENRGMTDQILDVVIPVQDVVEVKNGTKKIVQQKVYPGYVLIRMFMNDDTWYIIRNTRGVTSFVGPGSKPVPIPEHEIAAMGIDVLSNTLDIEIGESVIISVGPFKDSIGTLTEINLIKHTVTVVIIMFERETPLELDFAEITKI
jgi:transcription termination/antitermination protein NusG